MCLKSFDLAGATLNPAISRSTLKCSHLEKGRRLSLAKTSVLDELNTQPEQRRGCSVASEGHHG